MLICANHHSRLGRAIAGLCGIAGLALLTLYFLVPFPLPRADAATSLVLSTGLVHGKTILLDAGLQAMGSSLIGGFLLSLPHLLGRENTVATALTTATATVFIGLGLLDAGFAILFVEAAGLNHGATASVAFDLTNAMSHVFQIAPPVLFPLGFALWRAPFPRTLAAAAIGIGAALEIAGLIGLYLPGTQSLYFVPLAAQQLWIILAAGFLILYPANPRPPSDTRSGPSLH